MDEVKCLFFREMDMRNFGLDAAIFLQTFRIFFASKKGELHEFENLLWISLSEADIREILPFWSQTQIDKVVRKVMNTKVMKKKRIYSISHGVCFAFVKNQTKE